MLSKLHLQPTPAADVIYPAGSIVVCWACGMPLYVLTKSLYYGESVGKSVWKYAPVQMRDMVALMDRSDLEPGQRAALRDKTLEDLALHCDKVQRPKAGDLMDCPACKASFAHGWAQENTEGQSRFADRGYQIGLAIIPPAGQARKVRH